MALQLISYPQNCLNSIQDDCLLIKLSSLSVIKNSPTTESFSFNVGSIPSIGDTITLFVGSVNEIVFTFSNDGSDLSIPIGASTTEQAENIVNTISSYEPLVGYSVVNFASIVAITAINSGAQQIILNPTIASSSLSIITNVVGADAEMLEQYHLRFFIYDEESGDLIRKSPPYYVRITDTGNEIDFYLNAFLRNAVYSEFNDGIGFYELPNHSKKIRVKVGEYSNETTDKIIDLGIVMMITNAKSNLSYAKGLDAHCDCFNSSEDLKFLSHIPYGLKIAPCTIVPLHAFICVANGGSVDLEWKADLHLNNGTTTTITLHSATITTSKTIGYLFDSCEDAAISAAGIDPCDIASFDLYLAMNTRGNPLDYNTLCEDLGSGNFKITFSSNGTEFGADSFLWEFSLTGASYTTIGSDAILEQPFTEDEIGVFYLRHSVTIGGCTLTVTKKIRYGSCQIQAGFDFSLAELLPDNECEDFSEKDIDGIFTVNFSGGDPVDWEIDLNITDIYNEIVGSGATNIIVTHGFDGVYNTNLNQTKTGIDPTESVLYLARITYDYNGHSIRRELQHTVTMPPATTLSHLEIGCEDLSLNVNGLRIEVVDTSIGGSQITSVSYEYGYAANGDMFDDVLFVPVPSFPLDIIFENLTNDCVWVKQTVSGCGENRIFARRICFECVGCDYTITFEANPDGASCTGGDGRIIVDNIAGALGGAIIELWDEGQTTLLSSVTYTGTQHIFINLDAALYVVKVVDGNGCDAVQSVVLPDNCQCSQPESLTVSTPEGSSGTVNLFWSEVDGAIYYVVEWRELPSGTWNVFNDMTAYPSTGGNPDTNSVNIDSLNCGTLVVFRVKAVCRITPLAESGYIQSEPHQVEQCPCTFPVVIENIVEDDGGGANNGGFDISDTTGGTSPYSVIVKTLGNLVVHNSPSPTTLPHTVSGLQSGTYIVVMTDADGCSGEIQVVIPSAICRITIDDVDIVCNGGNIDLSIDVTALGLSSPNVRVRILDAAYGTLGTFSPSSTINISGLTPPTTTAMYSLVVEDINFPSCNDTLEIELPSCNPCENCNPSGASFVTTPSTVGNYNGSFSFYIGNTENCASPFTITSIVRVVTAILTYEVYPTNTDPDAPAPATLTGTGTGLDPFVVDGVVGGSFYAIFFEDANGCESITNLSMPFNPCSNDASLAISCGTEPNYCPVITTNFASIEILWADPNHPFGMDSTIMINELNAIVGVTINSAVQTIKNGNTGATIFVHDILVLGNTSVSVNLGGTVTSVTYQLLIEFTYNGHSMKYYINETVFNDTGANETYGVEATCEDLDAQSKMTLTANPIGAMSSLPPATDKIEYSNDGTATWNTLSSVANSVVGSVTLEVLRDCAYLNCYPVIYFRRTVTFNDGCPSLTVCYKVVKLGAMNDCIIDVINLHGMCLCNLPCAGITRESEYKWMTNDEYFATLITNEQDYTFTIYDYVLDGVNVINAPFTITIAWQDIESDGLGAVVDALNAAFPNGLTFGFNPSGSYGVETITIKSFDCHTFSFNTGEGASGSNPYTYTQAGLLYFGVTDWAYYQKYNTLKLNECTGLILESCYGNAVADFDYNVTTLNVDFTDTSDGGTGTINQWLWQFSPDATPSFHNGQTPPTIAFAAIGVKTATLTIITNENCHITKEISFEIT